MSLLAWGVVAILLMQGLIVVYLVLLTAHVRQLEPMHDLLRQESKRRGALSSSLEMQTGVTQRVFSYVQRIDGRLDRMEIVSRNLNPGAIATQAQMTNDELDAARAAIAKGSISV